MGQGLGLGLGPGLDKNISEEEYQAEKNRIVDKISAYENVVNLSLIIEASVEASFQFVLQTTFILPSVILAFTDPAGRFEWADLVNWRFISIGMSFASFSFGFYKIRLKMIFLNSFH